MGKLLKSYVGTITVIALACTVNSGIIKPGFISDFFDQKNINLIITFACWESKDVLDYSKRIMNFNKRISYNAIDDDLNMKNILTITSYKIGIVLDMDCSQSQIIFDQFTAARLPFNESYHWLSLTQEKEVPVKRLEDLPLTVESELTLALAKDSTYELYDIYNHAYSHNGRINVTYMGHWKEKDGLINNLRQFKYTRRQNFNGMTLNVSIVLRHPQLPDLNTYLTTPINSHLDTWSRWHYVLVLYLSDMYNFKINLSNHDSWGYLINGTFNGVLGEMMKGVVDISAAPFQYLKNRMDVCDYTAETFVAKPFIIFRHPKKSSLRNPFLKPFAQNIWWLALNVGIICWIILIITVKTENGYEIKKSDSLHEHTVSETAIITVAAVSQQGSSGWPYLLSGRIVFFTLFFWALLMYQFYSASIVGSLLAPPPRFIKDLWDLANSDLHVGSEDVPYSRNFFRTTTDPAAINLYNKKFVNSKKNLTWISAMQGLEEVKKGGYGIFIDTATAYKVIESTYTQEEICELCEIALIKPPTLSIVVNRHSPFKKMVVYGLRKMMETGLTKRQTDIYNHRRPICPESFQAKPVPVELEEFTPAIFMVLAGLLVAGGVMLVEYLVVYYNLHGRIIQLVTERDEKPQGSSHQASSSEITSLDA